MNESSTTELNKSTVEIETPRNKRIITVEPPLFLFMFSATLVDTVFQNLVLSRLCLNLGHNTSVCDELSKYPTIEEQVQPDSAIIFMIRNLIETILPAAILIFLGPWSDKHGRKPIMIYPLMGHVILYGSYFILSTEMAAQWNVYFFLVPSIAITFSGGYIAFVTGIYCYLSDVTLPDERAWRLGVVEAVLYTGLPLGIASSSYVFYWGGYLLVFGLASLAIASGLLYVIFLPESVDLQVDEPSSGARGLCDKTLVLDLLQSCLQRRPGRRRTVIFLVLFMLTATVFCILGEMYVEFLYTRKLYHWTIKEYSIFSSVAQISTALGSLVGLYIFSTKLRLPDASLAALSSLTKAISSLIRALATHPYVLFIGSATGVLSGMAAPLGRAVLSKSVSKEDVGKIFSVNAALDALAPIAASPSFTVIYNSTLTTLPGAFYFLTAAVSVVNAIFLGGVALIHIKHPIQE